MPTLPCIKADGTCIDSYDLCLDYESCKAACEAMQWPDGSVGGCPGGPSWYNLPCSEVEEQSRFIPVSCCDPWEGESGECREEELYLCPDDIPGFHPMCPAGCSELQVEECELHLTAIHVCCIGAECHETTEQWCEEHNGDFKWEIDTCENNPCDVDCRFPQDPYWKPGEKEWSLDHCTTAIVCLTKPPTEHVPDITARPRIGQYVPITAHTVRALDLSVSDEDPCQLQYGIFAKGEDGRYHLLMCSQTDGGDAKTRRYNRGYLSKATVADDNAVVPIGRYFFKVGIERYPDRAVQYGQYARRCVIDE